jgi:hypothetical protein
MEFRVERNRGMYQVKKGEFVRETFRDEALAQSLTTRLNLEKKEKAK